MTVLNQHIDFIRFFIEKQKMTFYFVPGIILNHFSYRKSIFRYPSQNFMKNSKKKFGSKNRCFVKAIDFSI